MPNAADWQIGKRYGQFDPEGAALSDGIAAIAASILGLIAEYWTSVKTLK